MLKITKIDQDKRGELYVVTGDLKEHQEILLLATKKGFARGGCIHKKHNEFYVILEGRIKYFIGSNPPKIISKGQSGIVPKNTPHYMVSLTDSLMLEWGPDIEEKQQKHKVFRNKVDQINALFSKK